MKSVNNPRCRRCTSDRVSRNGYNWRANGDDLIKFKCRECNYHWSELSEDYALEIPKLNNPPCKDCKKPARKNGFNKSRGIAVQRYLCPRCHVSFQDEVLNTFHLR